MERKQCMIYKKVIESRLDRKRAQLKHMENVILPLEASAVEKRKYIELKAVIMELENVLDIASAMFDHKEIDPPKQCQGTAQTP
ncbi:MAG: hypothetical protein SNG69_07215 [Rikenellaceae bacterium]